MKITLEDIKGRMELQDNLATAHPIYAVQQRRRIYGLDIEYVDDYVWINEEGDKRTEKFEDFEDQHENWTKTGYKDTWEFVQPFFSLKGAEKYIKENKHNLTDPRVYVYSAHRNDEWQAVREYLNNF